MTQAVWRIAADTPGYEADDLTGAGAQATGGRWNEAGTPLVYAADSRALAGLETVVHLKAAGLPLNRYLVEIGIPDDAWTAAEVLTQATAPVGWDALPYGRASVAYGMDWIRGRRSAVLIVPSVIVPDERNVLINPQHPDAHALRARKLRRWVYDPRLAPGP